MSLLVWDKKYSVGIDSIDAQHKELLNLINRLNTAMALGEANMEVGEILSGLIDYTKKHFTYEESLLEKSNYAGLVEHKQKHTKLINQINHLREQYEADFNGSLCIEIMQFLQSWLINHIQKSDMAYSKHLVSQGIK